MMKGRLAKLEKWLMGFGAKRCPTCFGVRGEGMTPRTFIQYEDEPPQSQGLPDCYDENGCCRRCGAQARDIIIRVLGAPPLHY